METHFDENAKTMKQLRDSNQEGALQEIAEGVHRLGVGSGLTRVNVYLVASGSSWVLVDAGMESDSRAIREAATSLFGADAPPAAILLTHDHPDHSGSALELARTWKCNVFLHPRELPLANVQSIRTIEDFAIPIDRWFVLPLLLRLSPKRVAAILRKSNFGEVARGLDLEPAPPGLPEWKCVEVPGHSPGHIAFFRPKDGVLLAGDAVLTVNLGSLLGLVSWLLHASKRRLSIPPYFISWDWEMAKRSAAALTDLRPRVIASGHGDPLFGEEVSRGLRDLAESLAPRS